MRTLLGPLLVVLSLAVGCTNAHRHSDDHGPAAPSSSGDKRSEDRLAWRFRYDQTGRLTQCEDPADRRTSIAYESDPQNRVRAVTTHLPDGSSIVRRFNRFGRCVEMIDAAGSVQYDYDGFGRLTSVRREGTASLRYNYDGLNRLISMTVADRWTIGYHYDFLGRLAAMQTPVGEITYDYQSGQRMVVRTLPNGMRTVWKYQPDGRLASINHVAATNIVLARFEYEYRADGLLTRASEYAAGKQRTMEYQYDIVQRLTSAKDFDHAQIEYRYDKVGNRTELLAHGQESVSASYDWAGRMVQYGGQPCTHDAVGNLTSYFAAGRKRAFGFDAKGLLQSAGGQTPEVKYEYDGNGYLIARRIRDKTTTFVPDPRADIWRPLVATSDDGKQTLYVWDENAPLLIVTGDRTDFLLADHLSSIRCVADKKGESVQQRDYDPFGTPHQEVKGEEMQPGFAGLFFDQEASLYLTRARAYDPNLGRFLQRELLTRIPPPSQKYLVAYSYCGGDPVNFVDTDGADARWAWRPDNMAWLQAMRNIFDATAAKQWYAEQSRLAIAHARGSGLGASVAADTWDIIGGLIPGKPANEGQGYAQGIWSVATLGGGQVLTGLGAGRTFISSLVNSAEGRRADAALDIVSLGGAAAGLRATEMLQRGHLPERQLTFPFVTKPDEQYLFGFMRPDIMRTAGRWKTLNDVVTVFDAFRSDYETARIPTDDYGSGIHSPMTPSNVGGIDLGGAGGALKDLGQLCGIASDDNGRLILLTSRQGEIRLPSLRLDDVVTVFRSVYQYGEAPYVSIDPNPEDIHGPKLLTWHGKATLDTYVGWVLFEADRMMKSYSLGYDNVTRQAVTSHVPQYKSLFDLGFSNVNDPNRQKTWERFWIVPAEVSRRSDGRSRLTLLDVPLKVRTQAMVLRNGRLEEDPEAVSSKEATAFAIWFTRHYDDIAREVVSQPPLESGFTAPVPVFAELQRIALMSAVAESLRDQGVPMPGWMEQFQVKSCPVTRTTPSIVVQSTGRGRNEVVEWNSPLPERVSVARVYGGVSLSPSDDAVHAVVSPEAEELAPAVRKAVASAPSLVPVEVALGEKHFQAVALPGSDTRALGACRLAEADLVVPLQGNASISLTRYFNSFVRTSGELGAGWSMDLPKLCPRLIPTRRSDNHVESLVAYQLSSPLNSWSALFRNLELVPEISGTLQVPTTRGAILGLADAGDEHIDHAKLKAIFRDGRSWYFDEDGYIVAIRQPPKATVYRRDAQHRVQQIEGWYGNHRQADIQLEYNGEARLVSARGSNGQAVAYTYSTTGLLVHVKGPTGSLRYAYQDGLVQRVEREGRVLREFEYTSRDELRREKRGDGSEIVYDLKQTRQGTQMVASITAGDLSESAQFDFAMRPTKRVLSDGTQREWTYRENGDVQIASTAPDGDRLAIVRSAEDRKEVWQLPEGGSYHAEYDAAGRLLSLAADGHNVLRRDYRHDGQLQVLSFESSMLQAGYRDDGAPREFVWMAPGKGSKTDRWLQVKLDEAGRAETLSDFSGLHMKLAYDESGRFAGWTSSPVGGQSSSVRLTHNKRGHLETVETSWGYRQTNAFDPRNGRLLTTRASVGQEEATVEYDQDRPTTFRHFDGGEVHVAYCPDDTHGGQVRQVVTPNQLVLDYQYGPNRQPSKVMCRGAYQVLYRYDEGGRVTEVAYEKAAEWRPAESDTTHLPPDNRLLGQEDPLLRQPEDFPPPVADILQPWEYVQNGLRKL